MLLPKKHIQVIEAIIFIAEHPNGIASADICSSLNVKPRYLEQELQALVQAGIIKGAKGRKGGYTLAREKRKITLGMIYRVLHHAPHHSPYHTSHGPLFQTLSTLDELLMAQLDKQRLDQLANAEPIKNDEFTI